MIRVCLLGIIKLRLELIKAREMNNLAMEWKNQLTKTPYLVLFLVLISMSIGSNLAFAEPLTLFHTTFVDSFSVAGQDIFPINIAFSSDGTKMFVLGETGDKVNEYTLVTAFDVSTASFVDSFSVAGQETGLTGVAFSSDDTKMFVAGSSGDDVNEYNITLILPSCSPPVLGIWIIMESCEISSDIIAPASVMIQNNSVVIVNSGGSLIIPSGENIIIVNGSALKLIQGSNLQVNS